MVITPSLLHLISTRRASGITLLVVTTMPTVIMIPFIIVGLRITAIILILRRRKTGTAIRRFAEVGEDRLPPNHAKVIVF